MKMLRTIHLTSGCLFAPLLLLFTISGIWQRLSPSVMQSLPASFDDSLSLLSTLHTGRALKFGQTLSSGLMTGLVIAMSISLILTIVLGVVMAFRFGHRKIASNCLLLGVLVPVFVCVLTHSSGRLPKSGLHGKAAAAVAPAFAAIAPDDDARK